MALFQRHSQFFNTIVVGLLTWGSLISVLSSELTVQSTQPNIIPPTFDLNPDNAVPNTTNRADGEILSSPLPPSPPLAESETGKLLPSPLGNLPGSLEETIHKSKRGVISIRTRISHAAYSDTGEIYGTGFIINKQHGIILTNRHIASTGGASNYEITFYNGQEVEASLLYQDHWQDFAFLKVDPAKLPTGVMELPLFPDGISLDKPVFIAGKNEGQDFSIQTGRISSLYESVGHLPGQSVRISLNTRGGASGSPVFNTGGQVIGLIHSSDLDSASFALPINYATDALKFLLEHKTPPRKGTGMLVDYYSLDRAVKFDQFPVDKVLEYLEKYPDSLNRALQICSIFSDSPANGVLQVGDIVWEINGTPIGPNLYLLDKIMNDCSEDTVKMKVYRAGKLIELSVGLYNIQANKITRMVYFGGAIFYEVDDLIRAITSASKGSVFVSNIDPGTSFFQRFPGIPGTSKLFINVVQMDRKPIKNLDDLVELIPLLIAKKDFNVIYRNYAFYVGHSNMPNLSRAETVSTVTYNPLDSAPAVYSHNPSALYWDIKPVLDSLRLELLPRQK